MVPITGRARSFLLLSEFSKTKERNVGDREKKTAYQFTQGYNILHRLQVHQIEVIEHEKNVLTTSIQNMSPRIDLEDSKGEMSNLKLFTTMQIMSYPDGCFARLFKKYVSMCPDSPAELNAFYMMPSCKPTKVCWYTPRPLGHNTLTKQFVVSVELWPFVNLKLITHNGLLQQPHSTNME